MTYNNNLNYYIIAMYYTKAYLVNENYLVMHENGRDSYKSRIMCSLIE